MSTHPIQNSRYAKVIEASKRVRWDIDRDVIRGRSFDFTRRSCPTACRWSSELPSSTPAERRFL